MNRRIAALAIAVTAVLGLTACSSGSDAPNEEPAASAPATAPEEPTSSEQSVAEACLELAGPMQEASTTMAGLADAASDPQAAVDAWTALVEAYEDFAASLTNAEVKAAAADVARDTGAVRDVIAVIYVDGDTGAIAELTTATTDMQESLTALTTLCAS